MSGYDLTDAQWAKIEPLVPGGRKHRRGPRSDNRRFINAIVWMARHRRRWADLPARYGCYQTVKRRYYRWLEAGVLDRVLEALADEVDLVGAGAPANAEQTAERAGGRRGERTPTLMAARVLS